MTDYRKQAIKDMQCCYNLKDFAVAQREARLRLEEALRQIKLCSSAKSSVHIMARAALNAVKEG